ncbi:MAG: pseudouridine synthase [Polyangiaceae bacterium]
MAILYVDEQLAVWSKPSGELVHPGWARGEPTSMTRLRDELGRWVYPVHRLDRGTSGALLMALDSDTARALGELFAAGAVRKSYLALARGRPPEAIEVDHPVRKGERGDERVPAVTSFERLAVSDVARCSLVAASPRTGRLHQIRRHLKHLSHPIVGDVRYGDGRINRQFRSQFELRRLALHAIRIQLTHPATGESLDVSAPLPSDLSEPLAMLGLTP